MSEDKHNMKDKKDEKKAADESSVKEAEKESEGTPTAHAGSDDAEGCADLKEKLLRLAAEFENYKRRSRSEIDSSRNSGKAELLKGLLPVIDEFELALMSLSQSTDKNLAKGIEMIYTNFTELLRGFGLRIIDAKGIHDPYSHEIVLVKESDEKEGTILEVIRKGYKFENMVLRPAAVIIAGPKKASEGKKQDDESKKEGNK